jgi:hypothetical protein
MRTILTAHHDQALSQQLSAEFGERNTAHLVDGDYVVARPVDQNATQLQLRLARAAVTPTVWSPRSLPA